jgi:hypothetical protein
MVARFFLGVGEAAVAPGFTLLTGMFYTRAEQPVRYVYGHGFEMDITDRIVNPPGSLATALRFLLAH